MSVSASHGGKRVPALVKRARKAASAKPQRSIGRKRPASIQSKALPSRSRPTHHASAEVEEFITPVLRVGCLVRARMPGATKPRVFTYVEGKKAAGLLNAKAGVLEDALENAIVRAFRKRNIQAKVTKCPDKSRRSAASGVIFQVAELKIEYDGRTVLARTSLTLCVQLDSFSSKTPGDNEEAFSKFWVRFFVPPNVKGFQPKKTHFTLDDIQAFRDEFAPVGDEMLESIEEPYQSIVREATGKPTLDVNCQDARFQVLVVASDKNDFSQLYSDLRSGKRLRDRLHDSIAARQIVALAMSNEARPGAIRAMSAYDYLTNLDEEKTTFSFYETPNGYRALLFRCKVGPQSVRFVGLTDAIELQGTACTLADAKKLAPNAVSSNLATDLGSLY